MKADSPDLPDPACPDPHAEDSGLEPAAETTELDADSMVPLFDCEAEQRLWLRAVIPLLQLRTRDADPSCRVQFALDRMCIAACERVTRILRGDLGEGTPEWPTQTRPWSTTGSGDAD